MLADVDGYVYNFWLYKGKQPKVHEIVINFVKSLPSKPFKLYCDSYYGSYKLAEQLQLQCPHILFTLSCQQNRPSALFADNMHKGLKKHEFATLRKPKTNITATVFYDRKRVNFISNMYNGKATHSREKNNGERQEILYLVHDYNLNMHGVDKADAFNNLFRSHHRNIKWTQALFHYVFRLICCNSWLIHNNLHKIQQKQQEFLVQLALKLAPRKEKFR